MAGAPSDLDLSVKGDFREQLPAPTWSHGDRATTAGIARFVRRAQSWFTRWILCRGSKVAYLRRLGVRIGPQSALLNEVGEYGTEPWLIEIGARVTITSGVFFLTHDGSSRLFRHAIEGGSTFGNRFAPIRVLDNSFVGVRSILMPGVTIGPNSIVGAGSVVTRDVPPGTVAVGTPARVVCTLDEYVETYRSKMIPGLSSDRLELRRQLTKHFWGEDR